MDLMDLRADGEAIMEVETLGGEVILQDPDGPNPGKPVTVTFAGIDSPEWRARFDELQDKSSRKGGAFLLKENERIELFAAVTKKWDGVKFEGKYPECNLAEVRKVYRRASDLLRQANRFIGELERFQAASPKSS